MNRFGLLTVGSARALPAPEPVGRENGVLSAYAGNAVGR
jgi:hypothetical protein